MGRYVYRNFIRGIVDECGHNYDHLFEGTESKSTGRDGAIERDIGLALACDQIKAQGENEGAATRTVMTKRKTFFKAADGLYHSCSNRGRSFLSFRVS
jgi:hypothetical protein